LTELEPQSALTLAEQQDEQPRQQSNRRVSRKQLLKTVGIGAAGAAGLAALNPAALGSLTAFAGSSPDDTSGDTPLQIFTAALIAEDLATTFYYTAMEGPEIHDVNLAGPHGTALNPEQPPNGNPGNVLYLRAALSEEIAHADLLRSLIGGTSYTKDPIGTFYVPANTFQRLSYFLGILDGLERAFIGAYLLAVREFSQMAADTKAGITVFKDSNGNPYSSAQLEFFAEVAASIAGVESEHRVLGRVIGNTNPANQYNYEQTDSIYSVYHGSSSAVVALTPFLQPGSGKIPLYFIHARENAHYYTVPTTGGIPPFSAAAHL